MIGGQVGLTKTDFPSFVLDELIGLRDW